MKWEKEMIEVPVLISLANVALKLRQRLYAGKGLKAI